MNLRRNHIVIMMELEFHCGYFHIKRAFSFLHMRNAALLIFFPLILTYELIHLCWVPLSAEMHNIRGE